MRFKLDGIAWIFIVLILILIAAGLSGCGPAFSQADPAQFKRPAAWAMAPPGKLPAPSAGKNGLEVLAQTRAVCIPDQHKLSTLQSWVRTVVPKG